MLGTLSMQQSDVSPAGYTDSLTTPDERSIFVVSDSLRSVGRRVWNVRVLEEKDVDAGIVLALTSPPATVSRLRCSPVNLTPEEHF